MNSFDSFYLRFINLIISLIWKNIDQPNKQKMKSKEVFEIPFVGVKLTEDKQEFLLRIVILGLIYCLGLDFSSFLFQKK